MGQTCNLFTPLFARRFGHRFFTEVRNGENLWINGEKHTKISSNAALHLASRKEVQVEADTIVITRRK